MLDRTIIPSLVVDHTKNLRKRVSRQALRDQKMAAAPDQALIDKLCADEAIMALGTLEPVPLDVTKLVTKAVGIAGNDEDAARKKIEELAADTSDESIKK